MTIEEKKADKEAESVWAKFAYTASDGKTYQVDYYNLDVIISVVTTQHPYRKHLVNKA